VYTAIAPFVSSLSDHPGISPFQHGYGYDPIANGMQWGNFLALVIGAAVFVGGGGHPVRPARRAHLTDGRQCEAVPQLRVGRLPASRAVVQRSRSATSGERRARSERWSRFR
jgi:hypothetical protein